MKKHGRKKPYTNAGITRIPCIRCGEKAFFQWQACADERLFRPLCKSCDIELNEMVLRWAKIPDWRNKIAQYKRRWQ